MPSCCGDSWRCVFSWQLLNRPLSSLSFVPLGRFRGSAREAGEHLVHSWTCPPVLQRTCCPCRPCRGVDQPWVIWTCQRTKWSVTSSPKRTSEWRRERERAIFMPSAVGHACMHEDIPAAVYTWHDVWCRVTRTQWGVLTKGWAQA